MSGCSLRPSHCSGNHRETSALKIRYTLTERLMIRPRFLVQRQMKCAEEGGCLNREWTRIHANSCSVPVWVRFELLFNRGGLRSHGTKTVHFPVFFDSIRVHSRPFAVQNCFPPTLSKLLTCRAVRSSASLTNSLDSMARTSFVVEPKFAKGTLPVRLLGRVAFCQHFGQAQGQARSLTGCLWVSTQTIFVLRSIAVFRNHRVLHFGLTPKSKRRPSGSARSVNRQQLSWSDPGA